MCLAFSLHSLLCVKKKNVEFIYRMVFTADVCFHPSIELVYSFELVKIMSSLYLLITLNAKR
jgi:hypothetical protein